VFDISFGELMVIGVVALIVIGPEKLPKVARTVGGFVGKAQRYAAQIRDDINRQIELEELRKTQQEIQAAAQQFEQSIQQEIRKTEMEVSQIQQQLSEVGHHDAAAPAQPAVAEISAALQQDQQVNTADTLATERETPLALPPSTPSSPARSG